ncbi:MAG: Dna2/Cas4 domain-containing protein [Thermoplasmata archaeon]|nr:Dna2/Cas4 domain-containing protein [Thermoplasmata archaeon]
MDESRDISASEIEKFAYCPLSWWLSDFDEEQSPKLEEGEKKHARLSRRIHDILTHEERAKESETNVLFFAIAATIVAIIGLAFVYRTLPDIGMILGVIALIWLLAAVYFLYRAETITTESEKLLAERVILIFAMVATIMAVFTVIFTLIADPEMAQIVEAIALVWLVGATFFLYRSLKFMELAAMARKKHGIGSDDIVYIDDMNDRPKMFISKKFGLRGRPDYVLLAGEDHIPVEVKTGRNPRGPLFSHILQTATYCVLLEEEYGKPPPFGLLKYENSQHEIDYTPDLKKLVLSKLLEMRELMVTKKVHRNHNRKGKCIHCSRRDKCPEKLA